jgi:prepilin-type N-terminal cleavage/methylation domain-containing protein
VPACLRAFTLVELLVVIAIIGVLVGAIALIGVKLVGQQRARYSETILRTVAAAIDQFATENPLRQLYNKPGAATFGAYPPYQIDGDDDGDVAVENVREAFHEPDASFPDAQYRLGTRLLRDLRGTSAAGPAKYVNDDLYGHGDDPLNDNRALFTYLAIYGGGVLNQVPQDRLKPLHLGEDEIVNPTGQGAIVGNSGAITVLGIHDAWDVPIEYFLNVKIVAVSDKQGNAIWQIADRQPVVASRGMTREENDAILADTDPNAQARSVDSWIFSQPLPTPLAGASRGASDSAYTVLKANGALPAVDPQYNGWLRARGRGDVLPFLP